jgi:hypothetical protein
MKHTLLLAIAFFTGILTSYAQVPTLTSATNNPVAGEIFYGYICDTASVGILGPGGAGVNWDFTGLTVDTTDTVQFMACSATPACDSFSGSTLVYFSDSTYLYGTTSSAGFTASGAYTMGDYLHFSNPKDFISLPVTYNTIHKDTAEAVIASVGLTVTITDSAYCDGYGALKLPGHTYPNTLRVHTTETTSMSFGAPIVSQSTTETYSWYMANFHHPILTITYDTAGTGTPYVSEVKYYRPANTTAVKAVQNTISSLQVYPSPAGNIVHIKFDVAENMAAGVVITDITGRMVGAITADKLHNGINDISYDVSGLAGGMYIVKLQNGAGTASQKFTVAR